MRTTPTLLGLLALLAAGVPAASAEIPPVQPSDLRLRAADLPAGWTVLPKETDTEEIVNLKKACETVAKQIGGFQSDFQGIGAGGASATMVFLGFPNEAGMKQAGPMIQLLLAKHSPKAFGTVYALAITDDPKTAEILMAGVAKRFAAARIGAVEALVAQGKHAEAAALLDLILTTLPDVASPFARAGDLWFYQIRPPESKKALAAYSRALALHAKDPLDAVLLAGTLHGCGSARLALGEREKALEDFTRGAETAKAVAPRLAARILLDKARVHVRQADEEGVFASLQQAFDHETRLGFPDAAAGVKEDADFQAFARKSRFSALLTKASKVKPPDAWTPTEPPPFDPAKDPLILLPPSVERNGPDFKLDEALEKALLAKCKGAGTLPDGASGPGRFTLAFSAAGLAAAAWDSIESLGCFDLRLAGSAATRGRGAELAALAAEKARTARMAFATGVRVLAVQVEMNQGGGKAEMIVTAAIVEESGSLLLLTRFKKSSGTTTVALRTAMAEAGAEILSRFQKARK
jgi:tetratricopeptide (TPR) repeat protein